MKVSRVLHCFGGEASFAAEWLPTRLSDLGRSLSHELVGVTQEQWNAASRGSGGPRPKFLSEFPSLAGMPTPSRLLGLANAIKPFDLVLTYGYDALDVAMAHTLFSEALGLPPLIHHETVLSGEGRRRSWYRRIALGRAAGLVVPNERLEEAALVDWQQPIGRVKRFAPGVAVPSTRSVPKPDALPGVIKRDGEMWLGARIESAADIAACSALVDAVSQLSEDWHLVIISDGLDTDPLAAAAESQEIAHRLHFASPVADLGSVMGLFEGWAGLSDSPVAREDALIAMASARPIIAVAKRDIAALLAPENADCAADASSAKAFRDSLLAALVDDQTRAKLGEVNHAFAKKHYDLAQAIDRYRRLYASAMGVEIKA